METEKAKDMNEYEMILHLLEEMPEQWDFSRTLQRHRPSGMELHVSGRSVKLHNVGEQPVPWPWSSHIRKALRVAAAKVAMQKGHQKLLNINRPDELVEVVSSTKSRTTTGHAMSQSIQAAYAGELANAIAKDVDERLLRSLRVDPS